MKVNFLTILLIFSLNVRAQKNELIIQPQIFEDSLQIYLSSSNPHETFEIKIFDQFGELVYSVDSITNSYSEFKTVLRTSSFKTSKFFVDAQIDDSTIRYNLYKGKTTKKNATISEKETIGTSFEDHDSIVVQGRIIDYLTKEAIQYGVVHIEGTRIGSKINDSGYFKFKTAKDSFVLKFSSVSYQTVTIENVTDDILIDSLSMFYDCILLEKSEIRDKDGNLIAIAGRDLGSYILCEEQWNEYIKNYILKINGKDYNFENENGMRIKIR